MCCVFSTFRISQWWLNPIYCLKQGSHRISQLALPLWWLSEGLMHPGHLLFQMHPSKSKTVLLNGNKKSVKWTWTWRLALALCPGWDRSSAWASGSDAAKVPCLSGSSSKRIRIRAEKALLILPKESSREFSQKGKKKAKKPMWEIVQLRLSVSVVLLHPSSCLFCTAAQCLFHAHTGASEPRVSWLRPALQRAAGLQKTDSFASNNFDFYVS